MTRSQQKTVWEHVVYLAKSGRVQTYDLQIHGRTTSRVTASWRTIPIFRECGGWGRRVRCNGYRLPEEELNLAVPLFAVKFTATTNMYGTRSIASALVSLSTSGWSTWTGAGTCSVATDTTYSFGGQGTTVKVISDWIF